MTEQVPEATTPEDLPEQPALDDIGEADNEAGEEVETDEDGNPKE